MAVVHCRRGWVVVVFAGIALGIIVATLPAGPVPLTGAVTPRRDDATVLTGAFHIHTVASDGTGTPEEIAAAAARAGLQFVVLTDHGTGARRPDAPVYRAGVLCVDAVEVSTTGGHYVAVGLGQTPFPLGGEPRDVVEDVTRFGGFGIVAHPDSPRRALRWHDWTAPIDGLEWLNADSEWRDEAPFRLFRALLAYPFRQTPALVSLFDRPVKTLERWDVLSEQRRIVGVPAADAHARIGLGGTDPYQNAVLLRMPSYEVMFRSFALRAVVDTPPTGDARRDAQALIDAVREGRVYSAIDALAQPGRFEFQATSGRYRAVMGQELPINGPVRLTVGADTPDGARLVLLRNGREVASGPPPDLEHHAPATPGVFRAEVRLARAPGTPPLPWIVGNPIYVRAEAGARDAAPPPETISHRPLDTAEGALWRIEHSRRSRAVVAATPTADGREIAFRWSLGSSDTGEYAAAVLGLEGGLAGHDRVSFRARADRPMRASIQIRLPGGQDGDRWQRSVYLDETPRDVSVWFDEMTPIGATRTRRPRLGVAQALLIVVDTTNTRPGTAGVAWVSKLVLEGAAPVGGPPRP